jgi:hypothetical protein
MKASAIQKLALATAAAMALVGVSAGTAAADDDHWRHGDHGRHEGWHHHHPGAVIVAPSPYVYAPPPTVVYAPPPTVVYAPPPVVAAPPAGVNVVLPIRIR